jgi:hypothetical protein
MTWGNWRRRVDPALHERAPHARVGHAAHTLTREHANDSAWVCTGFSGDHQD